MRTLIRTSILLLFAGRVLGQPYTDYIGAGHSKGIIVTSSHDVKQAHNSKTANGENTINGDGLEGKKAEAGRFLSQASIGYSSSDATYAANLGIEKWIDEQMLIPAPNYYDLAIKNLDYVNKYYLAEGKDSSELTLTPNWTHWRYGWWQNVAYGKDQLRNKVAFALSQILVISDETVGNIDAIASYYNMLSSHSFGNFRNLLKDMTLHAGMGQYLSHLNNPKAIPEKNIHPDQNFAREVMQLFTIGLYELKLNGERVKDATGKDKPTYTNKDIEELAKVFTGLGIGAAYPDMGLLYFGRGIYGSDMTKPMIMYESWHEPGAKSLFGTHTFPSGQTGMKDIDQAIDILFNHKNTAPFISKQLIQRLVTSNPSPAYVERVAKIFVNDGKGVRGNLGAVIKAILLDDEARSCESISDPAFGKISEPVLRYAHFIKGIGMTHESDVYLNHGYFVDQHLYQAPMSAPSVFNFFKPDHHPSGPLMTQGLVSPEMQIINSLSILNYPNSLEYAAYYDGVEEYWEDGPFDSYTDLFSLLQYATNEETLVNRLDLLFCNGNMQPKTREVIKKALKAIPQTLDGLSEKIKMGLYLTFLSPDYMVNK